MDVRSGRPHRRFWKEAFSIFAATAYLKELSVYMKKGKINPFETAYEQYRRLAEQAQSTIDIQEKNLIFRRQINLLGVMEFLLSDPETSN